MKQKAVNLAFVNVNLNEQLFPLNKGLLQNLLLKIKLYYITTDIILHLLYSQKVFNILKVLLNGKNKIGEKNEKIDYFTLFYCC